MTDSLPYSPPAVTTNAPAPRWYQPPQNQASFPPSNGGNGNRGRQGAKKKKRKGPPRPQAPDPTATTAATPPGTDFNLDGPPCFNCGQTGHCQVACPNPPLFYLCKDSGHPAVLCSDWPVIDDPQV
ncbi:hypothetical protein ZWY2020_033889 [Hordeum vulgare]|nr:hypothetical protein ZWY2020_033889 [Hordeum vulgare]